MIRMVIPDSGPPISLGKVDRMDLIDRFECPIIITDVVQMEESRTVLMTPPT